jgi:TonB-dependent receptor
MKQTLCIGVLSLCACLSLSARGIIFGKVTDAATGEALGFASVAIVSLNLGASTELDGAYRLVNVPDGTHTLTVSYVGYQEQKIEVTIADGQEYELNVSLAPEGVALQAVQITAQAFGQMAAVNQQINSNTIVNVISKERLQELPDQNAAEALGRLAGVAIQRDGGEGQKVVLRGLSPKYNSITVNGERIPSTDGDDRSVDLSMISPDMLAGVEFFKAIKPDMDADAVGGAVNFIIRKAPEERRAEVRLFGGYNGQEQEFGQPRGNFTFSDRFFKNKKLGLVFTANGQRVNRSSDNLETAYYVSGVDTETGEPLIRVDQLRLADRLEYRSRYGASAAFDFELNKNNSLLLTSNWAGTDRDELRRRRIFSVRNANQDYEIREQFSTTKLLTNSLSGDHRFGALELTWRGSYSQSRQNLPESYSARFREDAAVDRNILVDDQGPDRIPEGFYNRLDRTRLYDTRFGTGLTVETNATAQIDFKYNVKFGKDITGYLKTGAKMRQTDRERDRSEVFYRPYLISENPGRADRDPQLFIRNVADILMANFLEDYQIEDFLNGRFDMMPGNDKIRQEAFALVSDVNINQYNEFYGTNYQLGDTIRYNKSLDIDKIKDFYNRYKDNYQVNFDVEAEDYEGREDIWAGYLMGEFNIGKRLMLMGGIRMEDTQQQYNSVSATQDDDDPVTGGGRIVNVGRVNGYREWLPMAHLRYKTTDWMDVRLAYTQTLARPDFINLVPWERINRNENTIRRGKADLLHTTATNYDAQLSFYNNRGMFTVSVFYKELDNVEIRRFSRVTSGEFNGYQLFQPENAPRTSTVQGLELDLQSNLRQLPNWLSGVVFGANVTLVRSETYFPLLVVIPERFIPEPPFFLPPQVIDSLRIGRVPGQADFIANGFVGYEKGRFSGRVSLNFQNNTLNVIGERGELDSFNDQSLRVDVASKYKLDKGGRYQLFLNLNNLTNQPEASFLGNRNLQQRGEYFGATGEVGLAVKFF